MDDLIREAADVAGIPYNGATEQAEQVPEVTRNVTGDYLFTWTTSNGEFLRITCADVAYAKSELQTRVSVSYKSHKGSKPRRLLSRKRWILESMSGTTPLFTELNRWKDVHFDWPATLTYVSTYFEDNYETGDPFVWLDEVEDPGPLSYMLEPLVQLGEHTLIGARGGSLKSMTALAICLSLVTGKAIIPGLMPPAKPVRCLYLDYETNASTHKRRLAGLAKAKGVNIPAGMIGYKRMNSPLVQMKSEVQRLIALQGIGFAVVDSVGRAVGGETVGEAEVQSYYNATSTFGITMLSIGHTSKTTTETVAGNAQWEFQARSMWIFEAAKEHGSNAVIVGMHHRKVNEGELLASLNYAVTFGDGAVSFAQADDADVKQLTGGDLKSKIRIYLSENPNSTSKQITDGLEDYAGTVNRVIGVLNDWNGRLWKSDGAERNKKWMLLTPLNNPLNKGGLIESVALSITPAPVNDDEQDPEQRTYRLPYPDSDGGDDDDPVPHF